MYNERVAVTLSPALDSYRKYWRLAFARWKQKIQFMRVSKYHNIQKYHKFVAYKK